MTASAPPELPAADAKCGAKVDYVAKRLAQALVPLGFKRKARQFALAAGAGHEAHWQIVQLQGDKWNEGSRGAFFVNLAVQVPALMRLAAQRPGMDWLQRHVDEIDECHGQARQRLGQLQADLPGNHPCARPPHSDEFKFSRDTDLAALADGVVQAVLDVGLPWLQQHASLRAFADFEGSLLSTDIDVRVAAAVLLGEPARAQQILVEQRARFERAPAPYLASMRSWFAGMGLDVSALLPQPPRPPVPTPQRQAAVQAEAAQHAQRAVAIRAEMKGPAPARPASLAEAWVAEHRAAWRRQPEPLADLDSGRDIAALDATGREAVLCALLQLLVTDESHAGVRDPIQPPDDAFALDASVRPLLAALLPTLPAATEATASTVLRHMTALVTRWQHDLVTGGYPWGFALLVRWLAGTAGAPHRAALRAAIDGWLEAYAAFALRAHDALLARVAADQAAAEDPAHPLHEVLREAREREAELAARQPPPSADEVCRRIAAYPEQRMNAADKQAVALLRRERRRDPATGQLPVAWDDDDWGQAAQRAWHAAPAAMREAVAPLLQGWLEGIDARPTQRFLRSLRSQADALPPQVASAWRPWVLGQLDVFESTGGHTEWATTGARPGVGARLGEASENLLLGLLWWAWLDPALDAGDLEPMLQRVATAAWQRLPEVGARAPVVGGLVLRLCAGLGADAAARVAARGSERGASKQLKQAVQRALKEPLVR